MCRSRPDIRGFQSGQRELEPVLTLLIDVIKGSAHHVRVVRNLECRTTYWSRPTIKRTIRAVAPHNVSPSRS